jgi:hypothetical protein
VLQKKAISTCSYAFVLQKNRTEFTRYTHWLAAGADLEKKWWLISGTTHERKINGDRSAGFYDFLILWLRCPPPLKLEMDTKGRETLLLF